MLFRSNPSSPGKEASKKEASPSLPTPKTRPRRRQSLPTPAESTNQTLVTAPHSRDPAAMPRRSTRSRSGSRTQVFVDLDSDDGEGERAQSSPPFPSSSDYACPCDSCSARCRGADPCRFSVGFSVAPMVNVLMMRWRTGGAILGGRTERMLVV